MRLRSRLYSCLLLALAAAANGQILHLAEMNTTSITALDRTHTVILLTNGIMEEHGPFMPSYTDGYVHEALAADLARAIVAKPGWTVAMFPVIPLGTSAANVIGHQYSFPGSFTVSEKTVRAIYMDLADSFGKLGFRTIFIVDGHGGPTNNLALDTASDYFHDTYGGTMVHLLGAMRVQTSTDALMGALPEQQKKENGLEVHAGISEQSEVLFLRPDLVPTSVRDAPSNGASDFEGLQAEAKKAGWPGYLGAPRYASAAFGAQYYRVLSESVNALALDILSGKVDPQKLERYSTLFMKLTQSIEDDQRANDRRLANQHDAWLKAHPQLQPQ